MHDLLEFVNYYIQEQNLKVSLPESQLWLTGNSPCSQKQFLMFPKWQYLWIRVFKKLWFLRLQRDESYFWTLENLVLPSTTNVNATSSYARPTGEIFDFWGSLHTKLIKDQAQRQVTHQGGSEKVTFNCGWERVLSYLTASFASYDLLLPSGYTETHLQTQWMPNQCSYTSLDADITSHLFFHSLTLAFLLSQDPEDLV